MGSRKATQKIESKSQKPPSVEKPVDIGLELNNELSQNLLLKLDELANNYSLLLDVLHLEKNHLLAADVDALTENTKNKIGRAHV